MYKFTALSIVLTACLCTACTESDADGADVRQGHIVASMHPSGETRTAIGNPVDDTHAVGVLWTDGDELGVFDASGTSQKRYTKVEAGSKPVASFSADGTAPFDAPVYAYYPYNAGNEGRDATSLVGNLPATQEMDSGTLQGDYKYGRATGNAAAGTGHEFEFSHLFSTARILIDAEDTPLKGEKLQRLTLTATRGAGKVSLAGDFTFDARNGNWTQSGEGQNVLTMTWTNGVTLDGTVTGYLSLFPHIADGDLFTIEVQTDGHRATFSAQSQAGFVRERIYNFPVSLNRYQDIKVYDYDGNLVQNGPNTSPAEETLTGTFTCAALNVDGLPDINYVFGSTNADGPGASGTTLIGNTVNSLGWDFMAVSEDFEYHSQLAAALAAYNAGTWRGTITSAQLTKRADTDGLGFFWKKDGITATNETMVQYTAEEGGLTAGANTCIKKGFRHYEVTLVQGVTVDVYITHMNTYSGSGNTESNAYVKAQLAQLRQIRDYVVAKAKENRRPAIIMGDTNMRYTRHDIRMNFIDPVTAEGLMVADPWVEFHRDGVYPTWNTKSLMTRAMFKGDTENDICCADDQRGEVVDKMWYINVPDAAVQIKAQSCENDVAHFQKGTEEAKYSGVTTEDADGNILENQSVNYMRNIGLADHFPVVVKFEYTYKKQ